MRRDASATDGFTLVEVLVAMTVLALLAAVLLRGVVAVRSDAVWFGDHTARALLASSILNKAVGNRRLGDGTYRGQEDGRHWALTAVTIDAAEQASPATDAAPSTPWRPQRLTVRVEAPNRPVVLETVRLVTTP